MVTVVDAPSAPTPSTPTTSGSGRSRMSIEVVSEAELQRRRSSTQARNKTLETLRAEQEVQQVGAAAGGLTARQFRQELAKRGVSVTELRRATRESMARNRAGDDIQAQARRETEQIQAVEVSRPTTNIEAPTIPGRVTIPEIKKVTVDRNLFISKSEPSGQATGTFTIIPTETKIKIEEAQKKGSLTGILGGVSTFIASTEERLFGPKKKKKAIVEGSPEFIALKEKQKRIDEAIINPQKVRDAFGFVSEKVIDTSEFLARKVSASKDPEIQRLLRTPAGISRRGQKEFLTDVFLFAGFEPLIRTGTAGQGKKTSEFIEVVDKKTGQITFMKKSELAAKNKFEGTRIQDTTEFGRASFERQARIIKTAFEKAEGGFKKVYLSKQDILNDISKARSFMKESGLSKAQIDKIIQKVFPGLETSTVIVSEGFAGVKVKPKAPKVKQVQFIKLKAPKPRVKTKTKVIQTTIKGVELKGVSALAVTTTLLQRSKLTSRTKQASKQSQMLLSKQLSVQKPVTIQMIKTSQDVAQKPAQDQRFTPFMTQIPRLTTPTQILQDIFTPTPDFGSPTKPEPRKPKKPVLRVPKSATPKKKKKTVVTKKALQGFIAQVKDKGKWVRASKKVHTKDEALRIAGKVADNTTAVTIRAKKSSKKPVKPKSKRKFTAIKFRDYKISKGKRKPTAKNTFIEKKKNRIDTRGEKRKLSALAYLAKRRKR